MVEKLIMSQGSRQKTYDKLWAGGWGSETESHGPSSKHRKRLILNIIKKYKHCKLAILDIGCGDGFLLNSLKQYPSFKIFGLDVSPKAIELAQDRAGSDIQYLLGDLQSKEGLPKRKFDFIICSEVLEHLPNDKTAISNLAFLLAPQGKLLLTLPHKQDYWTQHDTAVAHLRRYEKKDVLQRLKQNGLNVVQEFTWGYPLYCLYYNLVLKSVKPETTWKKKGILAKIASYIFYLIFFVDDLFITSGKGRNLIILAEKI